MTAMNIQKINSSERGCTRLAWLDSRHSFSFGHYYDPRRMGFGALRVINEDIVAPGQGFSTHPHANMEIVSIVLAGALAHRDSMGHVETLRAGEVQRMSAGSGIEHSEYNPSPDEPVHFLQIWFHPQHRDRAPSYEQRAFADAQREQVWLPVVTPGGSDGSLAIDQDASIHLTRLAAGSELSRELVPSRRAWLQLTAGEALVEGIELAAGDGLAILDGGHLNLQARTDVAAVLFDLA